MADLLLFAKISCSRQHIEKGGKERFCRQKRFADFLREDFNLSLCRGKKLILKTVVSEKIFEQLRCLLQFQHAVTQDFLNTIGTSNWDKNEREVLMKLASLFAASCIEKRLGDFYAGGYATVESKMADLLRDGILVLCKDLVNEAASLVDVISPPDFILNSALGMSDGEVKIKCN